MHLFPFSLSTHIKDGHHLITKKLLVISFMRLRGKAGLITCPQGVGYLYEKGHLNAVEEFVHPVTLSAEMWAVNWSMLWCRLLKEKDPSAGL